MNVPYNKNARFGTKIKKKCLNCSKELDEKGFYGLIFCSPECKEKYMGR